MSIGSLSRAAIITHFFSSGSMEKNKVEYGSVECKDKSGLYPRCPGSTCTDQPADSPVEAIQKLSLATGFAFHKPDYPTFKDKSHYYFQRIKHSVVSLHSSKKWSKYAHSPYVLPDHLRPWSHQTMVVPTRRGSEMSSCFLEVHIPVVDLQSDLSKYTYVDEGSPDKRRRYSDTVIVRAPSRHRANAILLPARSLSNLSQPDLPDLVLPEALLETLPHGQLLSV